eukprot:m.53800 g.53800  ORF g.53800 m.53800 type:complete len:78 (+) comp7685_c1_seq1:1361-1594(+)
MLFQICNHQLNKPMSLARKKSLDCVYNPNSKKVISFLQQQQQNFIDVKWKEKTVLPTSRAYFQKKKTKQRNFIFLYI